MNRPRVITFWSTPDLLVCVGVSFWAGAIIAAIICVVVSS